MLVGPADEAVAGGRLPGGGSKAEQCDDAVASFGKVTELGARKRLIAKIMIAKIIIAIDILIPEV